MRILLVTVEPPLPFGNAAGRWYYTLLKGLVSRGHRVTALSTCSNPHDAAEACKLFPSPAYDLRCFPVDSRDNLSKRIRSFARPMSYLFSGEFHDAFQTEISRGYDVLHMEQLWTAYLKPDSWRRSVVNLHYLFAIDWRDRALGPVDRRIVKTESRLLRKLPNIATFSVRLSDAARVANPGARVFTIPLGLDLSLYPFDEHGKAEGSPTVGIIGSFNWTPSRDAGRRLIHELWPKIKRRVPDARLMIVGRGAGEAFPEARSMPDVTLNSDVPDAQPYFHEIDVLLYAPSVGSGMKVKVLEAFALGTTVVTNDEGIEGLCVKDGTHCTIASDDNGLVDRAASLLRDADARLRLRIAARRLVEEQCGSGPVVDRVAQMHDSIVRGTNAA